MHRHIVTPAAQLAYSTRPPSRSRHWRACWAGLNISHVSRRFVATSFFLDATGHIFIHYVGFIIVATVNIWSSANQMTITTQIFFRNCAECMSLAWQCVIASMLWARPLVCCVRQCLLGRYYADVTMCRCINYLHPPPRDGLNTFATITRLSCRRMHSRTMGVHVWRRGVVVTSLISTPGGGILFRYM